MCKKRMFRKGTIKRVLFVVVCLVVVFTVLVESMRTMADSVPTYAIQPPFVLAVNSGTVGNKLYRTDSSQFQGVLNNVRQSVIESTMNSLNNLQVTAGKQNVVAIPRWGNMLYQLQNNNLVGAVDIGVGSPFVLDLADAQTNAWFKSVFVPYVEQAIVDAGVSLSYNIYGYSFKSGVMLSDITPDMLTNNTVYLYSMHPLLGSINASSNNGILSASTVQFYTVGNDAGFILNDSYISFALNLRNKSMLSSGSTSNTTGIAPQFYVANGQSMEIQPKQYLNENATISTSNVTDKSKLGNKNSTSLTAYALNLQSKKLFTYKKFYTGVNQVQETLTPIGDLSKFGLLDKDLFIQSLENGLNALVVNYNEAVDNQVTGRVLNVFTINRSEYLNHDKQLGTFQGESTSKFYVLLSKPTYETDVALLKSIKSTHNESVQNALRMVSSMKNFYSAEKAVGLISSDVYIYLHVLIVLLIAGLGIFVLVCFWRRRKNLKKSVNAVRVEVEKAKKAVEVKKSLKGIGDVDAVPTLVTSPKVDNACVTDEESPTVEMNESDESENVIKPVVDDDEEDNPLHIEIKD